MDFKTWHQSRPEKMSLDPSARHKVDLENKYMLPLTRTQYLVEKQTNKEPDKKDEIIQVVSRSLSYLPASKLNLEPVYHSKANSNQRKYGASVLFVRMFILLVLFVAPVLSYNKHISYTELLKCKEFQGPADYHYEQFLDIAKFDHNKPSNGEVFRIKLYALTTKDIWMLLSPSTNLTEDAHEIGRFWLKRSYMTIQLEIGFFRYPWKQRCYPDSLLSFWRQAKNVLQ